MSELVHKVSGLSWAEVEGFAEEAMGVLAPECVSSPIAIPILKVLEFRLGRIEPNVIFCIKELPQGYEGSVDWDCEESRFEVALAPEVYAGLLIGRARDRMTAAHELGHFILHRDVIRNFREAEPNLAFSSLGLFMRKATTIAPWENPERQAEVFAGRFLIPRSSALPALQNIDLDERQWLKDNYQVSDAAAAVRLREMRGG